MLSHVRVRATATRTLRAFSNINIINDHASNNVSPNIAAKVKQVCDFKLRYSAYFKQTSQVGRNLHRQQDHPLSNIRVLIENHFKKEHQLPDGSSMVCSTPTMNLHNETLITYLPCSHKTNSPQYNFFSDLSPIVTVAQNFDQLLVPQVRAAVHSPPQPLHRFCIHRYIDT